MLSRRSRARAAGTLLVAWSALISGAGAGSAIAAPSIHFVDDVQVAPGVYYREFVLHSSHGRAYGHLLVADLSNPHVTVDLLHAGAVTERATVSRMADDEGAVGGINADFFDISEVGRHPVEATGATVGPAIADSEAIKGAVPRGQRFGPSLPPGTSTQDVIAVGTDNVARLERLTVSGSVSTPYGRYPLRGLNQYALPVNGIGAFTSRWGSASRARAVCGTDYRWRDGCTDDTFEVTVRDGKVTGTDDEPGYGPISPGTVVLIGREQGAQQLRRLQPGDRVNVTSGLVSSDHVPLRFAAGGFPIVRNGQPLPGLDDRVPAIRTSAGYGDDGHTFYMLALDGSRADRPGLTISELADVMTNLGADGAIDLDGGGSSTLVTRGPDSDGVTVRNHPSGGAERMVPEGIGVFAGE
ncbi:phosphodiester glycosidase family protein [Streptomyces sp. RB6PN25]|uniref:Phosphodiester glycosidase family protein n=1 Tax=Streptomyces humicola TaxID=2953240 RepID=A0ABT1PS95_9ACTN|nr:phosphodiester glycosidase family protein [Streptomyces humicola]MCQ4079988.1 phosphodiester glycosidase family protein [Streptomyces humicola]